MPRHVGGQPHDQAVLEKTGAEPAAGVDGGQSKHVAAAHATMVRGEFLDEGGELAPVGNGHRVRAVRPVY